MKFWSLQKEGKFGENFFCNLYKCCKEINIQDLKNGTRKNTYEAMQNYIDFDTDSPTLITHAGDWGIKKNQCRITSKNIYAYTIEDATHGGVYLNLEIDSVLPKVKRWFMSNMGQLLHEKIYPIPINILKKDWSEIDVNELRHVKKEKLCYANFTITSPYRIRVAEWAWGEKYIDCHFPKRYANQDIELSMPILKEERLSMKQFTEVLASYHFCIAPTGNGLDTFRTWECILCNTVPIVQDNWMNRVFSKIWPMIIVPRYEFTDVYQKINDFHEEYGQINYDYSLLLEENFDALLDRIEYESDRLRREYV